MAELYEPGPAAASVPLRERSALGFVRFARDIVVVASTAFLLAVVGAIGFTLFEMVTAPGRYEKDWSQGGVVATNLNLHVVPALLFLCPLFIGAAIFGTAIVLVVSGGRRALTAGRALDRGIVQFVSLVVVVAGIAVVVAAAASSSQSGEGVLLSRAAVVVLGLSLVATGITVMVQPQWRSARLAGAAVAVLAVLSFTTTMAGPASVPAQTSLIGTGGTLLGSGFWTADPRAKTGAVQSYTTASCPTPTYCIAWGQPPFGGSVWSVSTDGGAMWRAVSAHTAASPFDPDVSPLYTSVSCWDSSSCLAGSGTGPPLLTSDGGRNWSDVPGQAFKAEGNLTLQADCLSPRQCLLVGFFHDGRRAYIPILVTEDGGTHWVRAQLPRGQWSVETTSCPSTKFCLAVASTGLAQTPAILSSTDGGLMWRRLAPPDLTLVVGYSSSYLACTGAKTCLLSALSAAKPTRAEPYPPQKFGTYVTADGGRTWILSKFPAIPHGQQLEYSGTPMVACSARLCIAYRSPELVLGPIYSPVLLSSDHGKQWTVDTSARSLAQVAKGSDVSPLTCNEEGLCLAVGQADNTRGVIFYSNDGGVTWGIGRDARDGPPWA
jgi:hypothetical protein